MKGEVSTTRLARGKPHCGQASENESSSRRKDPRKMLSKVLRVYSTGHRKNDFSGAKNFYDIWVIDEPTERERRSSSSYFHQEEAEQEMNKLLTILDGQPCRLDGKYEKR